MNDLLLDKFDYYFELVGSGKSRGPNDPRGELFSHVDNSISVARETLQNSLDARNDQSTSVKVVFELRDIPTKSLPGVQTLRDAVARATRDNANLSGVGRLTKAKERLSESVLPVLRISDYGTKGVEGDEGSSDHSPLRSLIMEEGASGKTDGAGGSFGIGAAASFRASFVDTVSYITLRQNDDVSVFASSCLFAAFDDCNNHRRSGEGIFMNLDRAQNGLSVAFARGVESLGTFSPRSEPGTDIYIYDFTGAQDQSLSGIYQTVVNDFMVPIHRGCLEVEIIAPEKHVSITSKTLAAIAEEREDWALYYKALTESTPIQASLEYVGEVSLCLATDDSIGKKIGVQMMRKPLWRVKTLQPNGMGKRYAGFFICENEDGNRLLASAEPAAHNDWQTKGDRENRNAVREIEDFIKRELNKLIFGEDNDEIQVESLNELLPQLESEVDPKQVFKRLLGQRPTYSGAQASESPLILGVGGINVTSNQHGGTANSSEIRLKGQATGDSEAPAIRGQRGGKRKSRPSPNPNRNVPDTGVSSDGASRIPLRAIRWRSFQPNDHEGTVVKITALENIRGDVTFTRLGDDLEALVQIASVEILGSDNAQAVKFAGGTIKDISLQAGETVTYRLKFDLPSQYVLGIQNA